MQEAVPELAALLEGYFYDGWQEHYPDQESVIGDFVRGQPLTEAEAALVEVERVRRLCLDKEHLVAIVRRSLSESPAPAFVARVDPHWLDWLATALAAQIVAARARRVFMPGPGMRTLRFPADRSLGTLLRDDPETPPRRESDRWLGPQWEELGEARGDVTVPNEVRLTLVADGAAAQDLSPLLALEADALYGLHLQSLAVTDAHAVYLSGLTGLRALWLPLTRLTNAGLTFVQGLGLLEEVLVGPSAVTNPVLPYLRDRTTLRRVLFNDAYVTDEGLAALVGCTALQALRLTRTSVGDAGVAHLQYMADMRLLELTRTRITDAGLAHLRSMSELCVLMLALTSITDAGLAHLRGLRSLTSLDLSGTRVGDAGLQQLHELSNLRLLYVANTRVTSRGTAALRRALPRCALSGGI